MQRVSSPWQRNTDLYSLLLGSFFIVLIMLFGYLYKTDKDITVYDTYHHKLDRMRLLDVEIDGFLGQTYRYIDYDDIQMLEKRFNALLAFLNTREMQLTFGNEIYAHIDNIKRLYKQKELFLEDFKILNARATNSIHFLYDLRKTLEIQLIDDKQHKILLDDVFFEISQVVMGISYDEKSLQAKLRGMEKLQSTYPKLSYFVQHSRQFLKDVFRINQLKEHVSKIPLLETINHALADMANQYERKRSGQRFTVFLLTLFAFILMGSLIYSYRRIRRNTTELQAFRYAIEKSDNAIMLTNPQREIEYVNESFEMRTGYAKEEVVGKKASILKSNVMPEALYREINETLGRGEIWQGELINRCKDGTLIHEKTSIIPVFINDEVVQYLAIKLDITAYKEQQRCLKQAAVVYEVIGDGIIVTDKDKKIISVNPAFVEMFGYSEDELLGKEPMVIKTLREDVYFDQHVWEQLLNYNRWSGKIHNETKEGVIVPVWLTLTAVRDDQGEIENFIAIYTNLQEIITTQERAEYLAYHDSLTGLPNRAYFDMRIADILVLAQKKKRQVAVLFLDLDRFKVINDTLGHSVGDSMLIALSKRMRGLFDENVLIARMGGDEFVVTFMVEYGRDEVDKVTQKILSMIREPLQVHDYSLHTTASIGIALFPDDGKDKYDIVKHADSAMYAAKEKGKDTYSFYTEQLSLTAAKRLDLEQELKFALKRGELLLHYQPQYRLDSYRVTGTEALFRWHNSRLGQVSPEMFITVAEETGMIIEIGYYVLEEACRAFVRWQESGFSLETIAVNLSTVQLRDKHFVSKVEEIFTMTGIDPACVEIEITERVIMDHSSINLKILQSLREFGCKIAIDDFGTGYSSMAYLKKMPLDTIKIDKSFVDELPENTHDIEVTRAIIALSKSLGYEVIAEGIENEMQERFLKEAGCDLGQGYFYAKPMDEEAFMRFLDGKYADF